MGIFTWTWEKNQSWTLSLLNKGLINGKCYKVIGPSILIEGAVFLNLYGGVLYCGPHQSSLYILKTDEPQLNPYDSELIKIIMVSQPIL